ncbi:long-chain-fatty-acid--CoA ligase 4-like [Mizuhopecten yessoensis]|uniref:long-chain-fatty-acid--CoA ligase n=1 Tax=Mizuhopecten yessoensis TaxID=6573 RepID=A0A210Q6S0_MIZYE|nr:long-chain-fatty-acid--CoA ligase 4-like [Mizuhopecten yessoensis]OWF44421.1 Long-chain-fatty-acid--CoA ligase 4 [Mizuhopecten yessoensis]
MAEVWVSALVGVLKMVALMYDIITFVPYYIVNRPDHKRKYSRRVKGRPIGGVPGGPYRAVDLPGGQLCTSLFPDCSTVDDLFVRAVQLYAAKPCLGTRELLSEEDEKQPNGRVFKKVLMGDYHWITYEEAFARATNFGSGLLALGQKPRKNTMIFSDTRAEWMIAAQACLKYNFPVVTLYATLGLDSIVHGVNQSEVSYVITSSALLPKFKGIIHKMPKLSHLIYIGGNRTPQISDFPSHVKVLSMAEVETMGAMPENIQTPVTQPKREDIAVIMYTSGSTGVPKGVLISHGNLMCGMAGQVQKIAGLSPGDTYVGYLPLAHVLELSAELSCVACGSCIGYSSPLTLTDQSSKIKKGSKGDLSILKPSLMAAVPVIMDRLYKGVEEKVQSRGPVFKAVFKFAYEYKLNNLLRGYDTPILNKLIFQKIRELLGGNIRMMLSGGAPLSEQTQRFMNVCFCCPVLQGYGLTETCGAGTITEVGDLSTGKVGAPLFCGEVRLRDWPEGKYTDQDKPHPRGEILMGGGNIVQGYHKMEEKTLEDFTEIEGIRYFCTGDIGQFEEDGCLRIIDRKKDLVKLQAGEYVALSQVETSLKMSPLVEQICVVGDSRHSCTVSLVVPNQKNLKCLAKEMKIEEEDVDKLCRNEKLSKEFLKKLNEYGVKAGVEKYCLPQAITLVPEPWMPDSGLVTDSFKLKRKAMENHYKADIARMYRR